MDWIDEMSSWWMVRAGRGGIYADLFVTNALVLFAGNQLGALPAGISKSELTKLMASKQPEEKSGSIKSWTSQLYRFLQEVKAGDFVVTYNQEQRFYYVGTVDSGDYVFRAFPDTDMAPGKVVQWRNKVARDLLSVEARNSLGAIQTLFKLPHEVVEELKSHLQPLDAIVPEVPAPATVESDPASEAELRQETLDKADSFIEDAISRLGWDQMEELVAGILRGMGYRTRVAPKGADRGHDIFASPDGLGLEEPRIFVEVKHRKGSMSAPLIRFLPGRPEAGSSLPLCQHRRIYERSKIRGGSCLGAAASGRPACPQGVANRQLRQAGRRDPGLSATEETVLASVATAHSLGQFPELAQSSARRSQVFCRRQI